MTTLDNTRVNDRVLGANLGSAITSVVGRLAAWNDARVTRNALWKLSDRELDDIGLNRGDIYDIR
jgi:uncharacterized protein YjiS (DUF1127 family)